MSILSIDYEVHYFIAIAIEENIPVFVPHILYHVLIIGFKNFFPVLEPYQISILLMVSIKALLGITLLMALRANLPKPTRQFPLIALTLAILIFTPVHLSYDAAFLLIGYLNYTIYHNPTQNLMMIFVVPVSLFALRAVVAQPYRNGNQRVFLTALSALLLTLMTLSKPSYLIALLPALGLAVLYRLVRRLPVDWRLLIFGLGLPAVLMLALQYIVAYGDPDRASVQIGVLTFFRAHDLQGRDVLLRHLLSLVFPLVAYLLHLKYALKDDYLNFSWLVFGVSLIWSSFFYEGGARLLHGNFVWTAYAALFVLMFSTILFLLKHYAARAYKLTPGAVATLIAFGLHVISGVRLYFAILTYMN